MPPNYVGTRQVGAGRPGIAVGITGDSRGLQLAIRDATKSIEGFGSQLKGIALGIAGAFSVAAMLDFTRQSIELAAKMEGVKEAFDRIAQPGLLSDLQEATRGTVNDLELMRQAVRANNFKIPLEQLASLFEFATKRAAQTGESVDYLVESIVLGIGRKSPLILDNLGISAVRLREKLRGVGVETASVAEIAKIMGELIQEEMALMGDVSLTTAQKLQQVTAAIDNMKIAWGEILTGGGFFQDFIDGTTETVKYWKWGLDRIKMEGSSFKAWWKWFWSSNEDIYEYEMQWEKDLEEGKFSAEQLKEQLELVQFALKSQPNNQILLNDLERLQKLLFVGPPDTTIVQLGKDSELTEEELEKLRKEAEKLKKMLDDIEMGKWKFAEQLSDDIKELNKQFDALIDNLETLEINDPFAEAQEFTPPGLSDSDERYLEFWASTTRGITQELEKRRALLEEWRANDMISQEQYLEGLAQLQAEYNDLLNTNLQESAELVKGLASAFGAAIGDMVGSLIEGEEDWRASLSRMVETLIESVFTIVLGYMAESVAAGFAGGASVGGPFAALTGTAAAAATLAAFSAAVPAIVGFAEGGIAYGPTYGLVGEYPNASSNPEVIAPLSKLESMIGGGQVALTGKFIIQGKDLVYIVNNENSKLDRYR